MYECMSVLVYKRDEEKGKDREDSYASGMQDTGIHVRRYIGMQVYRYRVMAVGWCTW